MILGQNWEIQVLANAEVPELSPYRKFKITLEKTAQWVRFLFQRYSKFCFGGRSSGFFFLIFLLLIHFFYSFVPEGGDVILKTQATIKSQLSKITQQNTCHCPGSHTGLSSAETPGCSTHSCMCSLLILKTANKLILFQLYSNLLLFLYLLLIHHSPLTKQYIFRILKVKIKMKQNKCNLLLYVLVFVPVRVCTCMSSHVSIRVHVCKHVCYVRVSVSLSSLTDMWLLSTLFFGQGLSQNMELTNLASLVG